MYVHGPAENERGISLLNRDSKSLKQVFRGRFLGNICRRASQFAPETSDVTLGGWVPASESLQSERYEGYALCIADVEGPSHFPLPGVAQGETGFLGFSINKRGL